MQKYKYLVDKVTIELKTGYLRNFEISATLSESGFLDISFAWLKPIHEVNGPAGVDYGNKKKVAGLNLV